MTKYAIAYLAAGLYMAVVDSVWLTSMINTYRQHIGELLLPDGIRIAPAIAFYLLYIFGIVWFGVSPALANGGSLQTAALNGALLGPRLLWHVRPDEPGNVEGLADLHHAHGSSLGRVPDLDGSRRRHAGRTLVCGIGRLMA